MPGFDERAQGVPNDPVTPLVLAPPPGPHAPHDLLGVVLGDVVEVVGNGPADVELGIVLEGLEDRPDRARVRRQRTQLLAPGETRPCPLAAPAAYVGTGITRQRQQPLEGLFGPLLDEGAHGEFGREALGQLDHGVHRRFEVRQTMVGDVLPNRPLQPAIRHRFAVGQWRRKTVGQDRQGFGRGR